MMTLVGKDLVTEACLASYKNMVPRGMNSQAGYYGRAGDQLLCQLLLCQVVDAHAVLGGHEEEGFGRVEGCSNDLPLVFPEGVLCGLLAQLVHQHCLQQNFSGSGCLAKIFHLKKPADHRLIPDTSI